MITLEAPAKINLTLRVLGRRKDGYHDLDSVLLPLEFGDHVSVARAGEGIVLQCDKPDLPVGESNLMVLAARAYFAATGVEIPLAMRLEKRIPHGAGLGGGSSDAAAVLLALEQLVEFPVGPTALRSIAAQVGSDVPFFLQRGPARCTGRGEMVTPLADMPAMDILLLKPPFGIETGPAYAALAAHRDRERRTASPDCPGTLPGESHSTIPPLTPHNDFEASVFSKFILLPVLKDWLLAQPGVHAAVLSGSGSTVFAIFDSAGAARAARHRAMAEFGKALWTCVTRSVPAPPQGVADRAA